jgi:hypothetical protein
MANFNYQVTEQNIQTTNENDFQPIPAGKYSVYIEDISINETRAGTGQYLRLKLRVADGQPYANRIVWTYINFQNTNPVAERIGQQKLNQLLLSCGLHVIQDTDELLNRVVLAQVVVREASNGYEASNDVKAFYKNEVRAPSGVSNASQVAPTQQQNKNGIPPWHTESVGAEAVVPF